MKRRLLKLGLLLIAGAIVNVAVAWSTGRMPYTNLGGGLKFTESELRETLHGQRMPVPSFATEKGDLIDFEVGIGPARFQLYWVHYSIGNRTTSDHHFILDGWPMYAIRGQSNCRSAVLDNCPGHWTLVPVWPGFAINTIFYGAILWGMFAGVGMVKRRLRRRRGLCPACAYPIGTSPVCTECGAALDRSDTLQCDA